MERVLTRLFASLLLFLIIVAPAFAQALLPPATPPIVFTPGTGDGSPAPMVPIRPTFACAAFPQTGALFAPPSTPQPPHRLDQKVLDQAIAAYAKHHCSYGQTSGPALIVVVDFAKKSNEPRLYRIDLRTGDGVDDAIRVAHGIGSDPNDDGVIDSFSDVQDSLMSSLGAARGGEIYVGINGRSLRLDGLEPTNRSMRARDIVLHSYTPTLRRYFNGELLMARGGRPGTSEGCFVVEPDKRDWIMQTLVDGGFLYAGYSGTLPTPKPPQTPSGQTVVFQTGTGN
jgi:L,D-transpeptidase catalytic domain